MAAGAKGLPGRGALRGKGYGGSVALGPLVVLLVGVMVFTVSFLYSNLGLGGGLLYVPILLTFVTVDNRVAVAVSLTFTVATAASATINHHRKGLVDWRLGAQLLAGAAVGAVVGSAFTLTQARSAFDILFIAITLVFGIQMLRDWRRNRRNPDTEVEGKDTPPRRATASVATLGSGFVSGSVGIGGGLVNVPLLVYLLGRRTREAIGTSNLLIMPTALVGFLSYFLSPVSPPEVQRGILENTYLILLLWPVVFVGAYLGSRWGLARLKTRSVALIFIVFLFVAAARLALDLAETIR